MRTTIDLPDDVHSLAMSLARDLGQSLSSTVTLLIRRGLRPETSSSAEAAGVRIVDGFPMITVGRPTSTEDVRSLDDELPE